MANPISPPPFYSTYDAPFLFDYISTSFLTWSVQLISSIFSSTTIQNFPGISDLCSEVSQFQHRCMPQM